MTAKYGFGQCVAGAIRVVDAILSENYPTDQIFNLDLRKKEDFSSPDWRAGSGHFIGRVEAGEEEDVFSTCDLAYLRREIHIWINNGNHYEEHLATVIMCQKNLDGDEFSGWTKWKVEEFYYRDFSYSEEKKSWRRIIFLREKALSHEDWVAMKDSRTWIVVVGC